MAKKHELTLNDIKASPKMTKHNFRASDFMTKEQREELRRVNARGKHVERPYDEVDAFSAEILARFGYHAWLAWKAGEIEMEQMSKYIAAERARTTAESLPVQFTIVGAMAGANHPTKSRQAPKSLKNTIKFIKEQQKKAKGAQ